MARIILVHGMAATAKSWFNVPARLRAKSHDVTVVTLPGHGDGADPAEVKLAELVAAVEAGMDASEPAVLIGHSMGGFITSRAAVKDPDAVSKLIYVAAMLPKDGETIQSIALNRAGTNLLKIGREFLKAGVLPGDPALHGPAGAVLLSPDSFMTEPFSGGSQFPADGAHYIRCRDDLVIDPVVQGEMIDAYPGVTSEVMPTGHLPQKTAEDDLVKRILEALP